MQTIYVDTLLCVNMFIDYIMLYSVRKILRINSKAVLLLPASILAAVSTLGVFLPFYTKLFSVIYRVVSGTLTILVAFGLTSLKKFLIRLVTYIGISISFSGFIVLIWLMLKPKGVAVYNDAVYFDISPVMLILCTLIAFISLSVLEKLKTKHNPKIKIHKVTVFYENTECTFNSMVDTGCNLKEPFSGLPVIIAEKELIDENEIKAEKLRLVPYRTLSGDGLLKAFKPEKTLIDGREVKDGCYIGISNGRLTNEIKSLMGSEITEGL
ncbi:MAG: sigma-E processing peptidase SpoIIGA [Clostridia bacterium]|nr:sigma-E processing peptidase SpoIIGA [Clostridia bacterium]